MAGALLTMIAPGCGKEPAPSSVPRTRAIHGELERSELAIRKGLISHLRNLPPDVELWEGHEATPGDPAIDAVGALLSISADGGVSVHCTAMLIMPDVVITAAHCFTSRLCGGSVNAAHDDAFEFVQGVHAKRATRRNRVLGMTCRSTSPCDGDIALARLATPVAIDTRSDLRITDPDVDAPLIKIGYGAYHPNGSEPDDWVHAGTRSEAVARIDPPPEPEQGAFTYRGVNADGSNVEICGGDSGGPGIQTSGTSYRLVGITSGSVGASNAPSAANCNPFGTDTRLSVYADWIQSALATLPNVNRNLCP